MALWCSILGAVVIATLWDGDDNSQSAWWMTDMSQRMKMIASRNTDVINSLDAQHKVSIHACMHAYTNVCMHACNPSPHLSSELPSLIKVWGENIWKIYCIALNKCFCLNKCSLDSFWQCTPKFWWNRPPKQVDNEQTWLKNIYVVPLGCLVPPGCLSPHREHLFNTIRHLPNV